jgi:hypothetical protein
MNRCLMCLGERQMKTYRALPSLRLDPPGIPRMTRKGRVNAHLPIALLCGLLAAVCLAANDEKSTAVRAPLPAPEAFPVDVFFKDAFREALVGDRPSRLGQTGSPSANPIRRLAPTKSGDGSEWSILVSAETLESEVKALQMSVDQNITTPARFSSGGFEVARREFSELAVLFAVIGEFDGKVRWHDQAPLARDRFARAAANAKVSSPQAFQARSTDWAHVADRRPLMERFAFRYDEGIQKWAANATEFSEHKAAITREAELLRMFATVLTRDGMEDAGDEDYDAYCRELVSATDDLLEATRVEDYAAARAAAGKIGQACSRCHEDYRG